MTRRDWPIWALGHRAIDAGGGYTYVNPQAGHEFSAVAGFTYNLENPNNNYQNGVDFHLDWGASQFLTKQLQIGLVVYKYQQVCGDSGSGAIRRARSNRAARRRAADRIYFPLGDKQGYLNIKGFKEFDAADRPDRWNVWLTFVISPAAAPGSSPTTDDHEKRPTGSR